MLLLEDTHRICMGRFARFVAVAQGLGPAAPEVVGYVYLTCL